MRTIQDLLAILARLTGAGKLTWTTRNFGTFGIELSNYEICISSWTSPASDADGVSIRILDKDGRVLDEASADEFSPRHVGLKALFDDARRSANNVEAVLRDIERQLNALAAT